MCGRYALGATIDEIEKRFGVPAAHADGTWQPRFNLAPAQANPVIVQVGGRYLALMQWGLVPSWAKDARPSYTTINARVEGIESKPAYRGPLRRQRCLVPATGFYEWQAQPGASARAPRQAYHMRVDDGALFAFAGLYDVWHGPDGQDLHTYTILTTQANPLLAPIHERMPVILPPELEAKWLDAQITDPADLLSWLKPYPADRIHAYPVTDAVNSVAHDGAALIAPATVGGVAS